jgi:ribose/xylose/arabinose/galactoside ABC-type transport system permease subunit
VFVAIEPKFGSPDNLKNVLLKIAPIIITGAAVTLLMVAGSLDLSVGGTRALSGVIAAWLSMQGIATGLSFTAGIAVGAVVGLVNGLLVVGLRINPVIATLGSLYVAIGSCNLIARGGSITNVASDFSDLGTGSFGGQLAYPVAIMLVIVAVMVLLERKTLLGKYSIAMGSNFEGARLSGIRVNRLRIGLFVMSGAAAGIAGVIDASRLASGQPSLYLGFEFSVIVAAVLGGVSLAGGRGTIFGTCAGAAIVGVITTLLSLKGINAFWQYIIQGVMLVAICAIDELLKNKKVRASTPPSAPATLTPATSTTKGTR